MIQFSGLSTVDLDDPDVALWLDNYPDAQDFLDAVATLEGFIADPVLIDQCPAVIVEVCDTPESPGECGIDSDVNVLTVAANGTSFADLTVRHGRIGIGLVAGVTDTTIERVCFRHNDAAVRSILDDGGNHRTTLRQSFVDGASSSTSVSILGDEAVVEHNLALNANGIEVRGDDHQVSFNAAAASGFAGCFLGGGENGTVSSNVALDCDGALDVFDAANGSVLGNLFQGTADEHDGINASAPGNLTVENNIVRLTGDDGVQMNVNDGRFVGNLVERIGHDGSESGLKLAGSDNDVLHNLIRFSSQRAITIQNFDDTSSSGNLIQGNLLTRNHSSGVHLPPGFDFGGGPFPQADATTIETNIIMLHDGEGVSIPAGPDGPTASNTTLIDNTFRTNRTDICDESDSTDIDPSNSPFTLSPECVVEGADD